jgi:4-hydroxybenzoate polyprenyltransferase
MKWFSAFLKLVRWPNLVFIAGTQLLFYFFVYLPLYDFSPDYFSLTWLIVASVLIAAGGYIINDYFDINIDQINKPNENVLTHTINRRSAILLHLLFSITGILATAIAVSFQKWYLIIANIICVILLWLYSTSFKRQFLIGNIVISLLTAWTVLILFFAKVPFVSAFGNPDPLTIKFFRVSFLYAGFAFVISLIREAIKDVEDMDGDLKYGCTTLPIVAGLFATKIYTTIWIVVLTSSLIVLQLYILQFGWWLAVLYSLFFVVLPLFYLFVKHKNARSSVEFAKLSRLTKTIMLTGIISMIFFRIYF